MKQKRRKNVLVQDRDFYFDDCPICRAMKEADDKGQDLSLEELKLAFKKANENPIKFRSKINTSMNRIIEV